MTATEAERLRSARIAAARISDAAPLQELHVEVWRDTYAAHLPQDFYRRRLRAHRKRDWAVLLTRQEELGGGVLVARETAGISGLCQYGPTEDADDDPRSVGHVHRLYVHPERQRAGVGRALLMAAAELLAEDGFAEVTLWALENDLRARGFYEHLGWRADGHRRFDGVHDIRYRRPLSHVRPCSINSKE